MRRDAHSTAMGDFIIAHKMLIGKSESKSPLGRLGFERKDIKIDRKEIW
jgi:hypothetical protein